MNAVAGRSCMLYGAGIVLRRFCVLEDFLWK